MPCLFVSLCLSAIEVGRSIQAEMFGVGQEIYLMFPTSSEIKTVPNSCQFSKDTFRKLGKES